MKRGVSDSFRRAGLKAAGGVVAAVALGFLVAALWSFLANDLDWGSTLASLAIGVLLLLIALIVILSARKRRHEMPTGDDLKREMQARLAVAKNAAVDQARSKFDDVVQPLRDSAAKVGLAPSTAASARSGMVKGTEQVHDMAETNLGSMGKLIGAFAVGLTIASAIRDRNRDEEEDDFYDDL
nr:phage holin family protein [Paracoccus sp. C2R09]